MFVHVVAVTWRSGVWLGSRRGVMTSSFHKIYGLAVHTKTQGCRFLIYPLWDPVSKSSGFTLPKRWIRLDETLILYKMFAYTAKRISVWTGPKAVPAWGLLYVNINPPLHKR